MSRARGIKPGFYQNEDLAECSLLARFVFPGLWMLADREGRLEDRPKRIKAQLLPFDDGDVGVLLDELQAHGFLERYTVNGGNYIQITNFKKHQSPHYSEKASIIPPPSSGEDSGSTPGKQSIYIEDNFRDDSGNNPENSGSTPGISGENPELKRGSQPPDCCLLTPSSLTPEVTALSGSPPDGAQPRAGNGAHYRRQAAELLAFLNEKTGRQFRPVEANLKLIVARLKEGHSVGDCMAMIVRRCRKWQGDDKMREFLRPETLFNATKFAQYIAEVPQS